MKNLVNTLILRAFNIALNKMSIRCTVKAIITHNNRILLNKCFDEKNKHYYSLPGGGQKKFESLHEALVRECLEETGYLVSPIKFVALCEEICDDLMVREQFPQYAHKVHHIFVCKLCSEIQQTPTELDSAQETSEWIEISSLGVIRLLPNFLESNLLKIINSEVHTFCSTEHIPYNHG